jgi:arsenite methyltransferase
LKLDVTFLISRIEAREAGKDLGILAALLEPHATDKIADLGAGFGWVTKNVADRCEQVLAIEPDRRKVRRMHSSYPSLDCIVSIGEATPFRSSFLDRVYMRRSFHHAADQRRVVKELYRILKPKGWVVIQEVNPEVQTGLVNWLERKLGSAHMNFLPPSQMKSLLGGEGLSVSRMEYRKAAYFVRAEKAA